ncbi:MAG: glycerophosphodiester phosphodiesterase [Candidatus Binatia bacterium]
MADFVKIAHRGASGSYPENTRIAIEKAIEAGADMVEIDCQLSRDGHVVVFHDERLGRTAGVGGTVKGRTLQQLKKLDVGEWFKKKFGGERILTLPEALETVSGRVDLNLEIKQFRRGPVGIELKLLFVLSYYDYFKRAIISSLDYRSLRRVRERAPEARIGILYAKGVKDPPLAAARELGAYSFHAQKELLTPSLLSSARSLGLKTFVWTVNDLGEMQKFLALGVDGIMSDFPEKFWKIKARKGGR